MFAAILGTKKCVLRWNLSGLRCRICVSICLALFFGWKKTRKRGKRKEQGERERREGKGKKRGGRRGRKEEKEGEKRWKLGEKGYVMRENSGKCVSRCTGRNKNVLFWWHGEEILFLFVFECCGEKSLCFSMVWGGRFALM